MGIPIELRYKIFAYSSDRDIKPKKVLRYWFEKKEIQDKIVEMVAKNPGGDTPQPRYNDEYEEPDSGDNSAPAAEDDEEIDEDDNNEGDEDENENETSEDEAEMGDEDEHMADSGTEEADDQNNQATLQQDGNGEADENTADNQNAEAAQDAEEEVDENAAGSDGNWAIATNAQPPARPRSTPVHAHRKWRHIPNFLRITQCPPPVELFLINKRLNAEAKDWFYKVAVLKIDATASFAHMSFFEEALGILASAAYSPMENIKKAEVTFVWDTTWIRAEKSGFAAGVFPFFLNTRAEYVLKILQQAPELEQLVIHWHDSAEDDSAKDTLSQVLEPFITNLKGVETKIDEHYIASDAKPHARSIAGKRRTEFQNIMDNQSDTF